ncbi:MAG TPA: hypothetical protein VFB26_11970 [Gaiellaceae bacterium]|nr:hypothetical protein [Gaiellaceae bacterium]
MRAVAGAIVREHAEHGVPGLALETDLLRLTLFPPAGAKLLDLVHRPSGENLLWRNPRVPLRTTYPGAAFDDVWCGGWDELFPTDAPCQLGDNTFHDHGDLWCGPWECDVLEDDGETATVSLRRFAVALPCLVEKTIVLRRGSLAVSFRHRLENLGAQPVPFAWNLHVAHAIGPSSRVHLAADAMHVVPEQPGRFAGRALVAWPRDADVDLAAVPPPGAGLTEWLYSGPLHEGRCAVVHPARGVGLALEFDPAVFRTVWTWGVYGGWRGHYVLLTEPSTSPPGGLARNVADGTAAWLEPGGVLETEVVASVLEVAPP